MRAMGELVVCWAVVTTYLVSPVGAAPDTWDSRLGDLGVCYFEASLPAGTWYWKLISGVYEDESQAGGNHVIFYKCLDASGQPIQNQKCWGGWPSIDLPGPCPGAPDPPDNAVDIYTKGPGIDDYWGNFALYGGWCPFWPEGPHGPYGAWVDGPGDQVWGMGLPCNRHVNYRYIWQWTQAGSPPPPAIGRSPSSFTRSVTRGNNLASDTFTVWNSGGGTLEYQITDNAGWLNEVPNSGNSIGEADSITINYSTTSLGIGTHNATITITDPAATNSPQTISATVTVEPATVPGDFDGDSDVDQEDFGHFQVCLTGAGTPQDDPDCADAKLDGDVDVDQDDFAIFQGCMSGPNIPGNPDCAD